MKTTINWKTATDAEKNACFGKQVCGYMAYTTTGGEAVADFPTGVEDSGVCEVQTEGLPDYLYNATAVLPWLEKYTADNNDELQIDVMREVMDGKRQWTVGLYSTDPKRSKVTHGTALTFPEAAMIALLRAKGIEVLT